MGNALFGYLSDRLGERKALVLGLSIFIVSSVGCMLSISIWMLIAFRIVQAISVSSCATIWQSIVVTRFNGRKRQQAFGIFYTMVAISPVVAPILGSVIAERIGWRPIFGIISFAGIALLISTLMLLGNERGTKANMNIWQSLITLLSDNYFRNIVLMLSFTTGAYFGYLTIIPFIIEQLHRPSWQISYFLIPSPFLFMLGGMLSLRISTRIRNRRTLFWVVVLNPAVVLVALVLANFYTGLWLFILPMQLMSVLNGIAYPLGSSLAIGRFPESSGTAAGLTGAMQSLIAALVSACVAATITLGIVGFGMVLIASFSIAFVSWKVAFTD